MNDPYLIIKYPLSTEKAVREMEAENCLVFIVAKDATKRTIKWAAEKAFGIKVINVRTQITMKGHKKAYVKVSADTPVADITAKLGLV